MVVDIVVAMCCLLAFSVVGALIIGVSCTYCDDDYRIRARRLVAEALSDRTALEAAFLWQYQRQRVTRLLESYRRAVAGRSTAVIDPALFTAHLAGLAEESRVAASVMRLSDAPAIDLNSIVATRAKLQEDALRRISQAVTLPVATLATLSANASLALTREEARLRLRALRDFAPRVIFSAAWIVGGHVSTFTVLGLLVGSVVGVVSGSLGDAQPPNYHVAEAANIGIIVGVVVGCGSLVHRAHRLNAAEPVRTSRRDKVLLIAAVLVSLANAAVVLATDWLQRWLVYSTTEAQELSRTALASDAGGRVLFAAVTIGCLYGSYRAVKSQWLNFSVPRLDLPDRLERLAATAFLLPIALMGGLMTAQAAIDPSWRDASPGEPPLGAVADAVDWTWLGLLGVSAIAWLGAVVVRAHRRRAIMRICRSAGLRPRYMLHPGLIVLLAVGSMAVLGTLIWLLVPAAQLTTAEMRHADPVQALVVLLFPLGAPLVVLGACVFAAVQVRRRRKQDQVLAAALTQGPGQA
ncbi:hypothetical protein [Geodermatophilus africanus]|uniref:hypothetical protein n=1 Tax=Geodermatophilus africanus TaxID=1137993 RepID=UPI001114DE96|nr:hypothetical protein [Geodermatophilus africanus]